MRLWHFKNTFNIDALFSLSKVHVVSVTAVNVPPVKFELPICLCKHMYTTHNKETPIAVLIPDGWYS